MIPPLEVDTGVQSYQPLLVSDHSRDTPERSAVDIDVRVAPLRLVEHVDGVDAKCESLSFSDSNRLSHRRVESEHSGSPDIRRVVSHVTDTAGIRILKHGLSGTVHDALIREYARQR